MPKPEPDGALDGRMLASFHKDFESNPRFRQSMNAVCTTPVAKVALDRRAASRVSHTFSVHLEENKATSQMASGRCWLFAALNVLRNRAIQAMKLPDDFELSQNYAMFWDKMEKANYFLEAVLQTLDEPVEGRLVSHLLRDPVQDGGQWHMFTNIVRKYGVVPKSAMPETESSSSTGWMNRMVTAKLREYAAALRSKKSSLGEMRKLKSQMLSEVYRMLVIHLGEPPSEFFWQWRDKDKNFGRDGVMTPKKFYDKYIGVDLDDYVCLIHCPQKSKRFDEAYTIRFLGNVVGGEIVRYVNVDLDTMKKAAIAQLQAGESVWFGCDVGQFLERDLGVLDLSLFDFELVYGTRPSLDKAQRLDYGQSMITHAMVFTGVDLDDDGRPRRWRVENSWGDKVGDKGFLVMSDDWFGEFNYEVVVHKAHVPKKVVKLLEKPPVELEPWDPMGSLAS